VVEVNHDGAGFYSLIDADFEVPGESTEKGVFVGAYVNAGTSTDVLRIPSSAVIRAEGETRVVRMRADGRFEPVVVETGFIGTEWAEIRGGLDEGDAVVVRAQFLIDSESTLRAGLSRMAGD
jgi:Cu(I)/Ag(I) efflux system membrane fusion protein